MTIDGHYYYIYQNKYQIEILEVLNLITTISLWVSQFKLAQL